MTSYMAGLKPGDALEVKGPFAKYAYQPNTLKEVALIAGGSGITPMLQLTRKILKNPDDTTRVTLIFANRTEQDIMLKAEFDAYARAHPDRFRVHYILSSPSPAWAGARGRISKELLQQHLPSSDAMVFVCGPGGLVRDISGRKGEVGGFLKDLGFAKENVYRF